MVKGIQGSVFTLGDNTQNGTVNEYDDLLRVDVGRRDEGPHAPGARQPRLDTRQPQRLLRYFGAQAGGTPSAPWYSYNVGSFWHVIVLDSDCTLVAGGCAAGSPQHQFLVNDLAANSSRNVIAIVAPPALQLGRHEHDRPAAVRRRALRGARRPHPRRPRPPLRAPDAA